MIRVILSATAFTAMLVAVPMAAHAGQASATIQVSLNVQPACRVSATPLAFSGDAGHAIEAETWIAVACNGDIPLAVTLDGGAHADGGERRLASADGGYVAYSLYTDAGRQSQWGAGHPISATPRNGQLQLAAYGRVEPGATLAAGGTYEDTVAITVDF